MKASSRIVFLGVLVLGAVNVIFCGKERREKNKINYSPYSKPLEDNHQMAQVISAYWVFLHDVAKLQKKSKKVEKEEQKLALNVAEVVSDIEDLATSRRHYCNHQSDKKTDIIECDEEIELVERLSNFKFPKE